MARKQYGFTLIELLVALAIGSITLVALYQFYRAQQQTIDMREQIAAMQQSARAAMDIMAREIRMAGYDPTGQVNAGFVTDFTPPSGLTDLPMTYVATDNGTEIIAFTMNLDLTDPNISSANGVQEEFAYRLHSNVLERYDYNDPIAPWKEMAAGIETLRFVYRDKDGVLTAVPNAIRTVEITLVARTERPDSQGDHKTYTLRSTITPRNLGL